MGYINLYTFICVFFWISSMAFNICRKFSNIMKLTTTDPDRERRNLILIVLYCQVSPLLWCIFAFIMDHTNPDGAIRPNIGTYACFIGEYYPFIGNNIYNLNL